MATIGNLKIEIETAIIEKFQNLQWAIQLLKNDVNCRIEHGADSGGHLEYVEKKLTEMLNNER